MPTTIPYQRDRAVDYAAQWAHARNPRYLNFDGMGGDCTNFVSQCLYAGSEVMNYEKDVGWYYNSPADRAAGWSGVPYLGNFLLGNRSVGPFARLVDRTDMQPGDVIQLGNSSGRWYHSLLVTRVTPQELYLSTHTFDAHLRPLSSYLFAQVRHLHIEGVRRW